MASSTSVSNDEFNFIMKIVKWVVGVLVLLIVAYNCQVTVSAGHTGVQTQFGAATGQEYSSGFNFKLPWKGVADFNTQIQLVSSGQLSSASSDLQGVTTTVEINYRPDPTQISWIFQNVGVDYVNKVIVPAIPEAVKAVTAQYTAAELVTQRAAVKQAISDALSAQLSRSHVFVTAINVTDFNFSDSFNQAIEAKQVAQQGILTAQQVLDQQRIQAQQRIIVAQANLNQAKLDAQAIIVGAKAAQQAQQLQQKSLTPLYIELQALKIWNGILPLYSGGQLPFLTIPITSTASLGN